MGAAAAEADRTLFVGNLETKVTEELLFELFHQVSGWDQPFLFVFRSRGARPNGHPGVFRASLAVSPGTRPEGRLGLQVALTKAFAGCRLKKNKHLVSSCQSEH